MIGRSSQASRGVDAPLATPELLYVSYLIRREERSNRNYGLQLTTDVPDEGVLEFGVTEDRYYLRVGGRRLFLTSGSYTDGDTDLLLVEVNVDHAGDDAVSLYVNPDLSAGVLAETALITNRFSNFLDAGSTLVALGVGIGGGPATPDLGFTIDEIRVATDLRSLVPEPTSLLLAGGGIGLLSLRRRRGR